MEYTISFCTVCMNRLSHLKQTLSRNITDNRSYKKANFLLLDYNSKDGLEQYINENFQSELELGELIYFRTESPLYFDRSHSRNLIMKLSESQVICNLDADNYTGKDFANFVNTAFQTDPEIFLTAATNNIRDKRDSIGRICLLKSDFDLLGGFDERMKHYGYEDYDLINRLLLLGRIPVNYPVEKSFLETISHDSTTRIENEYLFNNLFFILASYINPASTMFVLVFKDYKFIKFTLIENFRNNLLIKNNDFTNLSSFSFLPNSYADGVCTKKDKKIIFIPNQSEIEPMLLTKVTESRFFSELSSSDFYIISDTKTEERLIFIFSQMSNKMIMESNVLQKRNQVNDGLYGRGIVYKNFDYLTPIIVD